MSLVKVSYLFAGVNTGGYDGTGQYYGPSSALVTNGGLIELVFYAFNSAAIYKVESGLLAPTVTVSYTLSNSDFISTQTINIGVFSLASDAQAKVDADRSDSAGSGFTTYANVFNYLYRSGNGAVGVKNETVNGSVDITNAVKAANTTLATGGGRGGAAFTQIPETYVSFTPSGYQSGLTYVSNVVATVTGYAQLGPPTISGTVSNQKVTSGQVTRPFSKVVLTDPGNPSGAGDQIAITLLNSGGESTGELGALTGDGLTDYGGGNYVLGPTTSVAALQARLNALVLHTVVYPGGPFYYTYELDYQAGDGGIVDNQLTTMILDGRVACYVTGTSLLTGEAERPVEALAIGDILVTASGEHRAIRWIGRRSYAGRFLRANPGVQPIRFRAGSLGDGLPRRDLLVSPEHAMFLHGVLVPARCLVNQNTIVRECGWDRVDYFHVELDSHDVLLAEGAPSESFVDDNSRGMFHNACEFDVLYPDAGRPDGFCAPRVEHGAQVEAIRRRLAAVAGTTAQAA